MNYKNTNTQNTDINSDYFDYLKNRSFFGFLYRKFWLYPKLSRHLKGKLLDVGCGLGDFLKFYRGGVGVDINPRAVEWCSELGLDARIMDLDTLPFDNAVFNGVVLDNVLEHLVDPLPLLSEIKRVLMFGGILIIGVPGLKGYASDPDHKKYYDESELLKTAEENNFRLLKMMHMPIKSDWLNHNISQYCLYGIFIRE